MAKGSRAARLLSDEAFNDACKAVSDQMMDRWKVSTDENERNRIWAAVNLIEQIKAKLSWAVDHGKLSRKRLEELTGARGA